MNLKDLHNTFAPNKISWRIGSTTADKAKGMALAYIDARDVQDRLDEVCGMDGWQCRYVPMHDKKTVCEIGVRCGDEWLWKSDGAGDSDVEAEKGALSDSFKRAAVRWGIGRYLYDLDSPWVEVDTYEKGGKVFVKGIKPAERKRLEQMLSKPASGATTEPVQAQTPPEATKARPPKMTPRQWGQDFLDALRVTKWTPDALEAHMVKNAAALVKLRGAEPVLHQDIMALVQTKQALHG